MIGHQILENFKYNTNLQNVIRKSNGYKDTQ